MLDFKKVFKKKILDDRILVDKTNLNDFKKKLGLNC